MLLATISLDFANVPLDINIFDISSWKCRIVFEINKVFPDALIFKKEIILQSQDFIA